MIRVMSTALPATARSLRTFRRRVPLTLWLGLAWILACEGLLVSDVWLSGRGALRDDASIISVTGRVPPSGYGRLARFVAVNMTPLVWPGYVVLLEGVLVFRTGTSPVRQRPHHFATLCLASVFIWCVFDWINFYYINAWDYIGMPIENRWHRYWGYWLAYGSVVPAMLMSGQVFMNLGWFDRAQPTVAHAALGQVGRPDRGG